MSLAEQLSSKRQELQHLEQLKHFSGDLVSSMEQVADKFRTLNEASQVVLKIVSNWDNVFALMADEGKSELVQMRADA